MQILTLASGINHFFAPFRADLNTVIQSNLQSSSLVSVSLFNFAFTFHLLSLASLHWAASWSAEFPFGCYVHTGSRLCPRCYRYHTITILFYCQAISSVEFLTPASPTSSFPTYQSRGPSKLLYTPYTILANLGDWVSNMSPSHGFMWLPHYTSGISTHSSLAILFLQGRWLELSMQPPSPVGQIGALRL